MFLAASLSPVEVHNSYITLPLTRRLNFSDGTINFLQHDKARVAAFSSYNTHDRRAHSIPVRTSFWDYTIAVGIGSPPTACHSNTWVGASTRYVKTDTSVSSGMTYNNTIRFIYRDTVTLGNGLTATRFPLGTIPTFTDYLYDQGKIAQHLVGIFFQPYIGNVAYTPPPPSPPQMTIGINQCITYGTTTILESTAGVVDNAYRKYRAATGGTFDWRTGLLSITSDQYSALRPLSFHIRDVRLDFNGYAFMQRFYSVFDGYHSCIGFAETPFTDATTN
ncbi:hypothetical protein BDR07DRAFT_1470733 [Suillus spraguei]|nr:hypothetical protein BDR07DRAFT_1470733 [Suillus spraguei]